MSQSPSSAKLRTDVANFMDRADEIVNHRLAQHQPSFEILMHFDPKTLLLTHANLDWETVEKESWLYLALCMRPIVFTEKDPTSFAKLTGSIGREHRDLAARLKTGRQKFAAWQRHMFIGQENLGPVPEHLRGSPSNTVTRLAFGPPDTVPEGIDLDNMVPDYHFADIYFNGCAWHSNSEKAAEYQAGTPTMKAYYAKCAEIRTLTAVQWVEQLRTFVLGAREAGYDF